MEREADIMWCSVTSSHHNLFMKEQTTYIYKEYKIFHVEERNDNNLSCLADTNLLTISSSLTYTQDWSRLFVRTISFCFFTSFVVQPGLIHCVDRISFNFPISHYLRLQYNYQHYTLHRTTAELACFIENLTLWSGSKFSNSIENNRTWSWKSDN